MGQGVSQPWAYPAPQTHGGEGPGMGSKTVSHGVLLFFPAQGTPTVPSTARAPALCPGPPWHGLPTPPRDGPGAHTRGAARRSMTVQVVALPLV